MNTHTPMNDPCIAQTYDQRTLEQKVRNKTALQRECGWPEEPKRPMICIPTGMSDECGGALFKELIQGLFTLPVEMVVLGKGTKEYGALFTRLSQLNSHRLAILPNKDDALHRMLAAADMALFCAPTRQRPEVKLAHRFGVVPVAPAEEGLEDYNPNQERGTAFTFDPHTGVWGCFGALVRAMETYRFPFDWRTIQRQCMQQAL